MKNCILHPLLLAAAAVLLPVIAPAQSSAVPGQISYQGRVLDVSGNPVGAGTPVNRTVIFRLWKSAASTSAADLLYSESQTVTISEGEFSVMVGQGAANTTQTFGYAETSKSPPAVTLASIFNGSERYLGVTVAAGAAIATTDNEITPRQQIATTAFAFRAAVAEGLAVSGAASNALSVTGTGNVGIGTTAPSALLSLGNSLNDTKLALYDSAGSTYGLGAQSNQFRFHLGGGSSARYSFLDSAAGTELMTLTAAGNLGLGTSTPVAGLAYGTSWKGTHINAGVLPAVSIVEGTGQARLHLRNVTNTLDFTRDLCLTNESNIATLRWMGAGLGPRVAIFNANTDGDMTFARNGSFGGVVTAGGGVAAPENTAGGGTGMRLVLFPGSGTSSPFGFGISSGTLWSLVPNTGTSGFRWFSGTTERMYLDGHTGNLNVTGSVTAASMTTSGTVTAASMNTSGSITAASMTTTGTVGIGTTNPLVPLHVVKSPYIGASSAGDQGTTYGVYLSNNGAVMGVDGQSPQLGDNRSISYGGLAAIFDGETVTRGSAWFGSTLAYSDGRAKKILALSDGAGDMQTLLKLKITDYTWIDHQKDSHRPHKQLIAQDVKEVFPQAVSVLPQPEVIPSVYETAEKISHDAAHGLLTITTKKAHGFVVGDLVDLYADSADMKGVKVIAVQNEHEFRVKSENPVKKMFVYGKQVKDFLTVDYDAISMLNVSATQQLKKEKDAQVAALEAKNAELSEKLAAQEKRLKALEAADKARDAKLAALERLLDDSAKPAVRTVLLKKDSGAE